MVILLKPGTDKYTNLMIFFNDFLNIELCYLILYTSAISNPCTASSFRGHHGSYENEKTSVHFYHVPRGIEENATIVPYINFV